MVEVERLVGVTEEHGFLVDVAELVGVTDEHGFLVEVLLDATALEEVLET